ncbi:MAG: MFS transporter [Proteobacteria bacterium]|nr:MFS transporter [Pseudomonadota bacterium]
MDRGNSQGWFSSLEIQIEAFVACLFLYLFLAQTHLSDEPFVDLRIFKDWNFSVSMLLSFTVGFNLMATMAILPPFMQSLLGYPVLTTGLIMAPRGIGTMVSMFMVSRLIMLVDARALIISGLIMNALSLWVMTSFDQNVTPMMLMWTGVLQGFGMGLMFVPMSSMAFSTIEARFRNDCAAFYSLGRNFGSSVGVSVLMGALAVYVRENRSHLIDHINPFNPALTHGLPAMMDYREASGLELLNQMVQREALMLGYLDDFRLMTAISLISIPFVMLLRVPRRQPARAAAGAA